MSHHDDSLRGLLEALRVSPDNVPLRRHLGDLLLKQGRYEEAENHYRQALEHASEDAELSIALARCFYHQSKNSQALVIVEELIARPHTPSRAFLLHARLLQRKGEIDAAASQYRRAVELDPDLEDATLAEELGVDDAEAWSQTEEQWPPRVPREAGPGGPSVELEHPGIDFSDVGGMDALKDEIRMKIIHPLTNPELYKAYGKPIGGGILMYGPPGCGKTHLARATAGEVHARFLAIGINDVLDMWLGNSERNLHELFELARSHQPCVLFIDEVDALGASRTDMRHTSGRQLINQFLAELDGVKGNNDGVLILAATNAPWHLDSAFRRPGRFDRILFVPPPDPPARAAIARILLQDKPMESIDHEQIAKKTRDFSGADLKAVVDVAVEQKLGEAMRQGKPLPLSTKDLAKAAKTVRPSTKEWFATARNYALYANQGGVYDDILDYLKMK